MRDIFEAECGIVSVELEIRDAAGTLLRTERHEFPVPVRSVYDRIDANLPPIGTRP